MCTLQLMEQVSNCSATLVGREQGGWKRRVENLEIKILWDRKESSENQVRRNLGKLGNWEENKTKES